MVFIVLYLKKLLFGELNLVVFVFLMIIWFFDSYMDFQFIVNDLNFYHMTTF